MSTSRDAPGSTIARWWGRLHSVPGGRWLFSRMIGWMAPYTGSIRARAVELGPGYSRWVLRDSRRVRNHLRSVHAVALVNLAEVASGTAMLAGLAPGTRGIVRGLSIEYFRKARGTLTAECRCTPPAVDRETDFTVEATITDVSGEAVARATVVWHLAPLTPAAPTGSPVHSGGPAGPSAPAGSA
jgi:acyl-coenzyme A thioesterase PaaI-like protein